MTGLLESALRRVEAFSPAEQDAIGAQIIETLDDNAQWERSFRDNPDPLRLLAQEAIDEHRRGETRRIPVKLPDNQNLADQFERSRNAAARIREIQSRSKPDPDGLTANDYIDLDRP